MIQAAIDPDTGAFLGLLLPKADLTGASLTLFGHADAWERLMKGEPVGTNEVGIIIAPQALEAISVYNMAGQEKLIE